LTTGLSAKLQTTLKPQKEQFTLGGIGSSGKPTTQGEIERFFRTFSAYYPRFNNLEAFRIYHDTKPHAGLNYMKPEQVYIRLRKSKTFRTVV